mgnify:CR=1 FL=1
MRNLIFYAKFNLFIRNLIFWYEIYFLIRNLFFYAKFDLFIRNLIFLIRNLIFYAKFSYNSCKIDYRSFGQILWKNFKIFCKLLINIIYHLITDFIFELFWRNFSWNFVWVFLSICITSHILGTKSGWVQPSYQIFQV